MFAIILATLHLGMLGEGNQFIDRKSGFNVK